VESITPKSLPRAHSSGSLHILLCSTFGAKCRARHFSPYLRAKLFDRGGHKVSWSGYLCGRRSRRSIQRAYHGRPAKLQHFQRAMARARDGLATRADSRVLTVSFHDPTLVRVEHAAKRHVAQIGEEDLARSYRGFRPVKTIIQRESRHWMHSMKGHLPLRPDRGLLLWRDSITSASGF
jgi:hypothetical protein